MKYLSGLIFILCTNFLAAQSDIPEVRKLQRISTPRLNIDASDTSLRLLKMEFNGSIPKSELQKVDVSRIVSITLVYTQYKLSETFDQMELNVSRMKKLFAELPGIKGNNHIQWYWVEQTGCDNPAACTDFFHGFVIELKSIDKTEKCSTEVDLLNYYVSMYEGKGDTKKIDSLIAIGKINLVKRCDTFTISRPVKGNRMARISGWSQDVKKKTARYLRKEMGEKNRIELELILTRDGKLEYENPLENGKYTDKLVDYLNKNLRKLPSRYKNKRIDTKVTLQIEKKENRVKINTIQMPILPSGEAFVLDDFKYKKSTEVRCNYIDTSRKAMPGYTFSYRIDDVVTKVFERNEQWKNCLVVTDVTGSMYPYLAQFKVWHKLNLENGAGNHDFVFFNDGDNKPDWLKKAGRVGGVYYTQTSDFDALAKKMETAMRNGGGGDGPENNIEAVLEGLKNNPNCKEVIMIADNWATPRDLELLDKVKVPIRLILCGAYGGFNTAYLDMIRRNGGSIHTMENDLYNLAQMKNGETIKLDGIEYRITTTGIMPVAR